MQALGRRSLVGWAAMLSGALTAVPAAAERCQDVAYPQTAGKAVAPGVREVFLTSQDTNLAAYNMLWLTDLVFQPGASTPADMVANDMVVLMQHGLLRVRLDEIEFVLKAGNLWGFPKGATLACRNTGADVAVLRVIDLLPRR